MAQLDWVILTWSYKPKIQEQAFRTDVSTGTQYFKTKKIRFGPLEYLIVTQNTKGKVVIAAGESASSTELLSILTDFINTLQPPDDNKRKEIYENNLAGIMNLMPELLTGLDVNGKFSDVDAFEFTTALSLAALSFDIVSLKLYHVWLPDPQFPEMFRLIEYLNHNELTTKMVDEKESVEREFIKNFYDETAFQCTFHGLATLMGKMHDGELAVLFQNNHFSTIFKHKKRVIMSLEDGHTDVPNLLHPSETSVSLKQLTRGTDEPEAKRPKLEETTGASGGVGGAPGAPEEPKKAQDPVKKKEVEIRVINDSLTKDRIAEMRPKRQKKLEKGIVNIDESLSTLSSTTLPKTPIHKTHENVMLGVRDLSNVLEVIAAAQRQWDLNEKKEKVAAVHATTMSRGGDASQQGSGYSRNAQEAFAHDKTNQIQTEGSFIGSNLSTLKQGHPAAQKPPETPASRLLPPPSSIKPSPLTTSQSGKRALSRISDSSPSNNARRTPTRSRWISPFSDRRTVSLKKVITFLEGGHSDVPNLLHPFETSVSLKQLTRGTAGGTDEQEMKRSKLVEATGASGVGGAPEAPEEPKKPQDPVKKKEVEIRALNDSLTKDRIAEMRRKRQKNSETGIVNIDESLSTLTLATLPKTRIHKTRENVMLGVRDLSNVLEVIAAAQRQWDLNEKKEKVAAVHATTMSRGGDASQQRSGYSRYAQEAFAQNVVRRQTETYVGDEAQTETTDREDFCDSRVFECQGTPAEGRRYVHVEGGAVLQSNVVDSPETRTPDGSKLHLSLRCTRPPQAPKQSMAVEITVKSRCHRFKRPEHVIRTKFRDTRWEELHGGVVLKWAELEMCEVEKKAAGKPIPPIPDSELRTQKVWGAIGKEQNVARLPHVFTVRVKFSGKGTPVQVGNTTFFVDRKMITNHQLAKLFKLHPEMWSNGIPKTEVMGSLLDSGVINERNREIMADLIGKVEKTIIPMNELKELIYEYQTVLMREASLSETGVLTPETFVAAGDYLVHHCPTWRWSPASDPSRIRDFLPKDKQFLITRNVPCHKRCKQMEYDEKLEKIIYDVEGENATGEESGWVDTHHYEKEKSETPAPTQSTAPPPPATAPVEEEPDSDDEDAIDLDELLESGALGDDDPNKFVARPETRTGAADGGAEVEKIRTYDLHLCYDKYYQVPRLFLMGYDENRRPLAVEQIYEDFSPNFKNKSITKEKHTSVDIHMHTVHPGMHAEMMKRLINQYAESGEEFNVEKYICLFLKFVQAVIPTIQYDFHHDI